MKFTSDEERFALMRDKLYTAVVADMLDEVGYEDQTMRPDIRPLRPDLVLVGRTRTFLWRHIYELEKIPVGKAIPALDSLNPGDVVVNSTDATNRIVQWGALMSTSAKMRGAVGCVVDGLSRDTKEILTLDFPVYSRGHRPTASYRRGIVEEYDVKIKCGDVIVYPGQLIFGDIDGIVVIPNDVEDKVLEMALEKVMGENNTRRDLLKGDMLADVFERYGAM
ncbi:RraA family protein [Candidatus Latescibacterota bacterium]